jgi:hypothetical protein
MSDQQTGYYIVNLELQHEGQMAGAPVLHLQLGVNAVTGQVSGQGDVTQALAAPYDKTILPLLQGQMRHGGFGEDTLFVHLTGEYGVPFPPPAIGMMTKDISIAMALSGEWTGTGSFTWNGHLVSPCTVTKTA